MTDDDLDRLLEGRALVPDRWHHVLFGVPHSVVVSVPPSMDQEWRRMRSFRTDCNGKRIALVKS